MMRRAQPWLGTMVEICIVPEDERPAAAAFDAAFNPAFDAAFAAIALVQRLMSFHDEHSDLSRLNRANVGEQISINPHTAQVLSCAEALRLASHGLFDIECAAPLMASGYLPALPALSGLPGLPGLPEWPALSNLPPLPDLPANHAPAQPASPPLATSAWCFDAPDRVRKLRPALLDLGGIAKGYAVDLAITALQQAGISSALVNAGGDMRAFGPLAWPVLLRDPAPPHGAKYQTELRNSALASSGAYFATRPHASNPAGQHASHLLDGRSKLPVCRADAVSVCAPDCMLADALCKVVFASGDSAHPLLAQFAATGYIIPA